MTVRLIEGWELSTATADYGNRWASFTNVTIASGNGRNGNGLRISGNNSNCQLILDNQPTWVLGCAFRANTANQAVDVFRVEDGTTNQLSLGLNGDGTLSVRRAGTTLGTTALALVFGAWYYLELKATIHDTTGSAEVRVNGVSRLGMTNVDN
jgi:hypothetical protein